MAANRRQEQPGKQSGDVYRLCDKVLGFVYGVLHSLQCLIQFSDDLCFQKLQSTCHAPSECSFFHLMSDRVLSAQFTEEDSVTWKEALHLSVLPQR